MIDKVKELFKSINVGVDVQPGELGHIVVESDGTIWPERLVRLLVYYFGDCEVLDYGLGKFLVDGGSLNLNGHETGTCKRCGCTNHDACHDKDTGGACHWVREDLCSGCTTTEEKEGAN